MNKTLIHKFDFYHHGEDILITDVVSDHHEVEDKIVEVKNKYATNHYILKNMEAGNYNTYVIETDMCKHGRRVTGLYFLNSRYNPNEIIYENTDKWKELFDFIVDGGTCMFLSKSVLNHKVEFDIFLEKWMSGQYTGNYLKMDLNHKTIGFASSTGYGDGTYYFYGYYHNNKLIGVKVFFTDNEDSCSE
jgi:hypothetical protein